VRTRRAQRARGGARRRADRGPLHAFGSTYRGRPVGAHSDYVCFSFQAIKELTTVDGGALVCRSQADFERGRLLRWYGIDRRAPREDLRCEADILEHGYKFHMNDVNATIGIEQLKYVAENIRRHRRTPPLRRGIPGLASLRPCAPAPTAPAPTGCTRCGQRPPRVRGHMRDSGVVVSQVHARNDRHTVFTESDRSCRRRRVRGRAGLDPGRVVAGRDGPAAHHRRGPGVRAQVREGLTA